ncbi:MarR family winged helix-turn-helix transcriptional regulator [Wenjunlia tyrosinilytica]|uniref:HTH marR-type domain-containing protein n=1 Tax=Wenjunlia tyrosinilytica TaxID=1544741 RepID=A0A917ZM58_9ACTN|nr:MarR family winged helix-turn-helix transcriptional regulator [Wenjunlia tyrosinilytica]GGO85261.1 hypothetical protein GCM10012280_18640 [Wenjunlia tyrosinilytica]
MPETHYPPSLLDQDVFVLSRIALTARRRLAERLAERDMNRWDVAVLAVLTDRGPTVQRSIAAALGIDPSDLVDIVDHLLSAGLAARDRDPADRRRYILRITSEGREAFAWARKEEQALREALLTPLNAPQREAWHTLLTALRTHPEVTGQR